MQFSDLVFIDSTGYHFADYPTILTWLQGQYQAIYGADVYIEPDSQDGQWIAVQAKALYDTAAVGASVYNSFSPSSAQGVGLSRVVKINNIARINPTHSTVDVDITGVAGTTITNGVIQDTLQQKWDLPVSVTIPGGGVITVTATAEDVGAITADADTVTTIYTPTLGWQSVNNSGAATVGVGVESDGKLRQRQKVSTANPSLTVFDGTIGALENLSGVTQVKGYENDTNSTDGNSIPAHTISCVVLGGDDIEICQTIQIHKTPGTGTYGTTSETVYDPKGMPLLINFFRPTPATVSVELTLVPYAGYSSDYTTLIAEALATAIEAFGIGSDVLITQLYIPAYLVGTPAFGTFDITVLELKKNAGSFAASNVTIAFNEIPVCDPVTNISITT